MKKLKFCEMPSDKNTCAYIRM